MKFWEQHSYVHFLRLAWDILKLTNYVGEWLKCKIMKAYNFLVIVLKNLWSSQTVIMYKGAQSRPRTSTFFSLKGPEPGNWPPIFKKQNVVKYHFQFFGTISYNHVPPRQLQLVAALAPALSLRAGRDQNKTTKVLPETIRLPSLLLSCGTPRLPIRAS